MSSVPDPHRGGPPTAAIYCRVSTPGQEEEGTSLDTQEARCRAYAAEHGYVVTEDHVYRDVHSGAQLKERPALSELRGAMARGQINVLIAFAVDRLSREQNQIGALVYEADDAGVRLEFVTEDFDNSAVGKFIRNAKAFVAEVEREKIVERTHRGKRAAAERGRLPTGTTLYGYRYLKGEGRCEIAPDAADIVRMIYRLYTEEAMTQGLIAMRLTDLGIRPPNGGARWHISTVRRILTNSSYAGRAEAFKWKSVPPKNPNPDRPGRYKNSRREERPTEERISVAAAIPPLISEETWDAAQAMRERNASASTRNRKREYLLAGHVFCAQCHRRYGGVAYRTSLSYFCPGSKSTDRNHRCRNGTVNARTIEADVWGRVEALLNDPTVIMAEVARQRDADPQEHLRADLTRVEQALTRLKEQERRVIRMYRFGEFDDELMTGEAKKVHDERARLEREYIALSGRLENAVQAAQDLERAADYCRMVSERVGSMTFGLKRLALEALGIRVTVDHGTWRVDGRIPVELPAGVGNQPS
jgi:site-specific DNA recombinase